jgi:hypothetical protein
MLNLDLSLNESFDPWRETPRKSKVIVLVSVFLFFTIIGFTNDIMALGREQPVRFIVSVVFSGLFAVVYAVAGISLRKNWWKGALPIFLVQFLAMGLLANRFPDRPQPASISSAEASHIRLRLTLDSVAIIVVVSLGYTGFFSVSVSEARRYVKTRTEKALLDAEMAAARQIQQVILPNPNQSFPGFAIESVYKPAREVGGDFFQLLPAEDGGLLLIIGDVSGKGLPAAMLVSLVIGSIRATAEETHDPAILLRKLNDLLKGRTSGGFATALAALITNDGLVTLVNAGHLSPYLDGHEIDVPGGLPLGITGGDSYEPTQTQLQLGSRLTFLSDGVVEAQNDRGELFGFDRAKSIANDPAASIAQAAVHFGQSDDITVVTIQRRLTL